MKVFVDRLGKINNNRLLAKNWNSYNGQKYEKLNWKIAIRVGDALGS